MIIYSLCPRQGDHMVNTLWYELEQYEKKSYQTKCQIDAAIGEEYQLKDRVKAV